MAFEPIENYGVIGNMQSIALVGMNGSIDFFCYPDFDSPTVFAALLDDQRGGRFEIRPQIGDMRVRQLYFPDTNILLTRFLAEEGVAELTDYMPIQKRRRATESDRSNGVRDQRQCNISKCLASRASTMQQVIMNSKAQIAAQRSSRPTKAVRPCRCIPPSPSTDDPKTYPPSSVCKPVKPRLLFLVDCGLKESS